MGKRSLYECFNARVKGDKIYCARGHKLSLRSDGMIDIKRLERGVALVLSVCQDCPDFDSMGEPVPKEERGWVQSARRRIK